MCFRIVLPCDWEVALLRFTLVTLVTSNWLSLYTVFTSGVKILAHDCKQVYVILHCFILRSFPTPQKKHRNMCLPFKKLKAKTTATRKRTRRKTRPITQLPLQRRRKHRRRLKTRLNTHLSRIQKLKRRNQVNPKKRKGNLISPNIIRLFVVLWVQVWHAQTHKTGLCDSGPFVFAEGERVGEEKEKEKEKREGTPTTTETTDAKDKTEVSDVKKGACLFSSWWLNV